MKSIEDLELAGKRVFIRADLNVPFDDNGNITDDTRIRESLPTIELALNKGARVILSSHAGRPKGKRVPELSLAPMAKRLAELLGSAVELAPDCIGDEVEALVENLEPKQLLLLENLRFHSEETKNDPEFSKKLGRLADIFINDAFAVSHRAHASIVGIVDYIAEAAAGLTLKRELDFFAKAFSNPKRPLVAIFGGAKVSTKLGAIENVSKQADFILVGGAMANTFFAANGENVGKSLYEPELLDTARELSSNLAESSCKLEIPSDAVVAKKFEAGAATEVVKVNSIADDDIAVDIGPEALAKYQDIISQAGTIVWNGPMGAFEIDEFSSGTYGIVDALIEAPGLSVVGGGDTDYALHKKHAFDKMDYVSTGGGAFLELLEGKELPGVGALE